MLKSAGLYVHNVLMKWPGVEPTTAGRAEAIMRSVAFSPERRAAGHRDRPLFWISSSCRSPSEGPTDGWDG